MGNPDGKGSKAGESGKPGEHNGVGNSTGDNGKAPEKPATKPSTAQGTRPGQGRMTGPDGTEFKPSTPSEAKEEKPSKPNDGSAGQSPGGSQGEQSSPPTDANKLFGPESNSKKPNRSEGKQAGQNPSPGPKGSGSASDETDPGGDPTAQAASRRLRQIVERIEKHRDSRPQPAVPGNNNPSGSDKRRDW
jgi:hypothetical protein